jgi:hypothetical protein
MVQLDRWARASFSKQLVHGCFSVRTTSSLQFKIWTTWNFLAELKEKFELGHVWSFH